MLEINIKLKIELFDTFKFLLSNLLVNLIIKSVKVRNIVNLVFFFYHLKSIVLYIYSLN